MSVEAGVSRLVADATTVIDASAPTEVTCAPSDTAGLALGANAVKCTARDPYDNSADCEVAVTVLGAVFDVLGTGLALMRKKAVMLCRRHRVTDPVARLLCCATRRRLICCQACP